ncbi:hypothetical protein [Helicobacter sp. 23-1045]
MIKSLLDITDNLPLFKNVLIDKDREYIERFYEYICAWADKSRALGYYAYRADSGDILAYYIAGLCYHLDKDFHNAKKFYETLCAKSDSQSTFRYIDGSELQLDSNAIKTLKGVAYRIIGVMYNYGQHNSARL